MNRKLVLGLLLILAVAGVAIASEHETTTSGEIALTHDNLTIYTDLDGTSQFDLQDPRDGDSLVIAIDDGTITFSGDGNASIAEEDIEGIWTEVTDINGEIIIDPDDKKQVTLGPDFERIAFRDIGPNDGGTDFNYTATDATTITLHLDPDTQYAIDDDDGLQVRESDSNGDVTFDLDAGTHDIEVYETLGGPTIDNESAEPVDVTLNPENVTASIEIDDPDLPNDRLHVEWYLDGQEYATETVDEAGTIDVTFMELTTDTYNWSVTVTDEYDNTTTSETFEFSVQHHAPEFDNSSASPVGDIAEPEQNLSIDVSDTDFAVPDMDEVNVTFYTPDGQVDSVTITKNTTAEVTHNFGTAEDTYWWAEAEDKFGHTATSDEFAVTTPQNLSVYDEETLELIEDVDNVTVEFYYERVDEPDEVFTRDVEDGTVNLEGLPADEPFVVVANADGYFTRRIFVQSLFETQSIYLLDEQSDSVQPTFELIDFTGEFDTAHTVIEIQKQVDGEWQTMEGDYFGAANEMPAQLLYNVRHRIVITNTLTENRRVLGTFTPDDTQPVVLEVHPDSEAVVPIGTPTFSVSPNVDALPSNESVEITAELDARDVELQSYNYSIIAGNDTLVNVSGTNPDGEIFEHEVDLQNYPLSTVNVTVDYVTTEEHTNSFTRSFSVQEYWENPHSILGILTSFGEMASVTMAAMFALLVVVFSVGYASLRTDTITAGFVGVFVLGLFTLIGFTPRGWLFAATVAWVTLSAIRLRI